MTVQTSRILSMMMTSGMTVVAIVCIPFHFPTCSIPVGIFQVVLVVVVVVVIILVDGDDDDDVSKSE